MQVGECSHDWVEERAVVFVVVQVVAVVRLHPLLAPSCSSAPVGAITLLPISSSSSLGSSSLSSSELSSSSASSLSQSSGLPCPSNVGVAVFSRSSAVLLSSVQQGIPSLVTAHSPLSLAFRQPSDFP